MHRAGASFSSTSSRRGLEIAPDLAVGDGALGFWKAIEEVFPGTGTSAVGFTRPPTC
jgi:Transposase, Mutator family.